MYFILKLLPFLNTTVLIHILIYNESPKRRVNLIQIFEEDLIAQLFIIQWYFSPILDYQSIQILK